MNGSARRSLRSAAQLILLLLVSWQVLYWGVGEVALRSPLETVQFTAKLVSTPAFWGHLSESAQAFGVALLLAVAIGLSTGFLLGLNRFRKPDHYDIGRRVDAPYSQRSVQPRTVAPQRYHCPRCVEGSPSSAIMQ